MSWAKLDDRLYDDPRCEAAGLDAMGLYVLALSYMAAYHTDGWITLARCRRLVGAQHGRRLAGRLVDAGWWEAPALPEGSEPAFRLLGWEAHLIPSEEASTRSARAAEAGRRGGRARVARTRPEHQGGHQDPPQGGGQGGDQGVPPTARSCPGPFPDKSAETLETRQATRAPDPDPIPTRPDSARMRAQHAHTRADVQGGGPQTGQQTIPFGPSEPAPSRPDPGSTSGAAAPPAPLTAATADPAGKRPRKKPAAPLPADWHVEASDLELGRSFGFDATRVKLEADAMRDWAASRGEIKADWRATFRNWLRTAKRREEERGIRRPPLAAPEPPRVAPPPPPRPTFDPDAPRRHREQWREIMNPSPPQPTPEELAAELAEIAAENEIRAARRAALGDGQSRARVVKVPTGDGA